ncbi:MAG: FCD domain-containing protein [Pseudomonas sp.]|jgi:GntR family transcriptional repressor for pyruvate dehydrogenase complex|nr:FCD domain-containing protein [Pseudomonas sp.]MDD2223823.1 FCD domain-containing protein [Pseudomonas sp.]MDY0415731.1 FCD domain-containing protein [Pseudomonas sp.]NLO53416.1 FCD domain-containing protein [Gammaproteobacteria bacterium]
MSFAHIQQRRLSDEIVEQLETMILEGTLQAGERLPAERKLAEQFGVSRPSLREAIQKLVAKGLLISRQGGGNYVSQEVGTTFSDPLLALLAEKPDAQKDLLEFRHTLEGACAYYAALRATPADHERLDLAFAQLEACYKSTTKDCRVEEGLADARFHLAIAEASHNVVLLHTIRGLFDLLRGNVTTNIGGMYPQRSETRDMLIEQHRALYQAIQSGQAEQARQLSNQHIEYVCEVLAEVDEEQLRVQRSERRKRI